MRKKMPLGQRTCSLAMISSEYLTYGDDMNSFIRQGKAHWLPKVISVLLCCRYVVFKQCAFWPDS